MKSMRYLLLTGLLYFYALGALAQGDPEAVDELSEPLEEATPQDEALPEFQPVLRAATDRFTQVARFEFSQSFFRSRGLEGSFQQSRFNGFRVDAPLTGMPRWRIWSGLYALDRKGESHSGPRPNEGGLLGQGPFDRIGISLADQPQGTHVRLYTSNRNIRQSASLSHFGRLGNSSVTYGLHGSLGTSNQGYVEGTPRRDVGLYAALLIKTRSGLQIEWTQVFQQSGRGGTSPLSDEAVRLAGRRYNPNWGSFMGRVRSGAERQEGHYLNHLKISPAGRDPSWETGVLIHFPSLRRGSLGYHAAGSPRPDYYRYLPSYYLRRSSVPPEQVYAVAREFQHNPQLDWESMYRVNQLSGPEASYFQYDRVRRGTGIQAYLRGRGSLKGALNWSLELLGRQENTESYGELSDLLGAGYVSHSDPFSQLIYDLDSNPVRRVGDRYMYHFRIPHTQAFLGGSLAKRYKSISAHLSWELGWYGYRRLGRFSHEGFRGNSRGASAAFSGLTQAVMAQIELRLDHRNQLGLTGTGFRYPVRPLSAYVFPEYSNSRLPNLEPPRGYGVDLSYELRWRLAHGRLSFFGLKFDHLSNTRIQYAETAFGSALLNAYTLGLSRLHLGLEGGVDFDIWPDVNLYSAFSLGRYTWGGWARTLLYPLPDTPALQPGVAESWDFGRTEMSGARVSAGPQSALSIGAYFRNLGSWRLSLSLNHFSGNYVSPSFLRRSEGFLKDYTGSGEEGVIPLREMAYEQEELPPVSLLRVALGRSWRMESGYFSFYFSINNLLDTPFKSGGFEQSRLSRIEDWAADQLSGNPVFPSKYWYGMGRTFSCSLRFSH